MADSAMVYNKAHMDEISKMYLSCADSAAQAYNSIESAANSFNAYYEGRGEVLFAGAMDAAASHMHLLEISLRALKAYVDASYVIMSQTDAMLSQQLSSASDGT